MTSTLPSFATPNSVSSSSSIPTISDFLFLSIPFVFERLVVVVVIVRGGDDVLDFVAPWTGDSGRRGAGECPSFKNDDDVVCGPTFKSLYPLISFVESMTLGLALNGLTAGEDEEGLAAFVVDESELKVEELCGKNRNRNWCFLIQSVWINANSNDSCCGTIQTRKTRLLDSADNSPTTKKQYADIVIDNSGTKSQLDNQAAAFVEKTNRRADGARWLLNWLVLPAGMVSALWTLMSRNWSSRL